MKAFITSFVVMAVVLPGSVFAGGVRNGIKVDKPRFPEDGVIRHFEGVKPAFEGIASAMTVDSEMWVRTYDNKLYILHFKDSSTARTVTLALQDGPKEVEIDLLSRIAEQFEFQPNEITVSFV